MEAYTSNLGLLGSLVEGDAKDPVGALEGKFLVGDCGQVWLLDFRRHNRSLASNGITHFFIENINRFAVLIFICSNVHVSAPDTDERPSDLISTVLPDNV